METHYHKGNKLAVILNTGEETAEDMVNVYFPRETYKGGTQIGNMSEGSLGTSLKRLHTITSLYKLRIFIGNCVFLF